MCPDFHPPGFCCRGMIKKGLLNDISQTAIGGPFAVLIAEQLQAALLKGRLTS